MTWKPTERLVVRVSPTRWQLAPEWLDQVNLHWSKVLCDRPHFYRGPVLAVDRDGWDRQGETGIETRFTDFAHFLFSRRYLEPGHPYHVRIVTACAWVITADGLAIVGLTHPKSSKPNVMQPIGGSPSLEDIRSGYFDPVAAAKRELAEETGLEPLHGAVRGFSQLANGSIAIAVRFDVPWAWADLSRPIRQHLIRLSEPELSDVDAIRPGLAPERWQDFRVLRSVQDFLLAPELSAAPSSATGRDPHQQAFS
ncbi:MAG: hypothetical protein M1600_02320 [Firmicutes bacterium]|nr:hypothetical protein [Bacillota bacterium]